MSSPVEDPRAVQARALAAGGRWEQAALLWQALAQDLRAQDPGAAAQALTLAADAWRRDDRPVPGVRALRTALDLHGEGPGHCLIVVQLAALMAETGHLQVACDLVERVADAPSTPGEAVLAADMRSGLLLELGRIADAEAALATVTDPRARSFRAAVLHRVVGRFALASAELSQALAVVGDRPELVGLRAALVHEQGELALADGRPQDADAAFQRAEAAWTEARRRSGLLRAAAGRVRAALVQGQAPLAADLGRGVTYAADRDLRMLEGELLVVRGQARARLAVSGAEQDLDRAVALAQDAGARLAEGRARAARRRAGILRRDDEARIAELLAGTKPALA